MDRLPRRGRRVHVCQRRAVQGRSDHDDVRTGSMPNRYERHLWNRDSPGSGLGSSLRPLLHGFTADGNQRQTGGLEDRLRSKAPDRPRARRPRPLVHGHPLGATHTRCATALLGSDSRPYTDAIGTQHASLKARGGDVRGSVSRIERHRLTTAIAPAFRSIGVSADHQLQGRCRHWDADLGRNPERPLTGLSYHQPRVCR